MASFGSASIPATPVTPTVYAFQPGFAQAPVAMGPDPLGQDLGYPKHCGLVQALPRCYPPVQTAVSNYPFGAAASRGLFDALVDGNPSSTSTAGVFIRRGMEPQHDVPGWGSGGCAPWYF